MSGIIEDREMIDIDLGEEAPRPVVEEDPQESERIAKIRKLIADRSFDFANPPPPQVPVYTLGDTPVAFNGDLTVIVADRGVGKSSFLAAGLASPMTEGSGADFLGFRSANPTGKRMIHIDTEQSPDDFDALVRRATRRARIERTPSWLRSVYLTGCEPFEVLAALEQMLIDSASEGDAVHSVWLDGVGDCAKSVNDELETKQVVRRLHAMAIRFDCPIITVLHLNPGSDFKSRGHLGSEIERKSTSVLKLKKEILDGREVVTVFTGKARKRPILESEGPRFTWSDTAGMHVSCASKFQAQQERKQSEVFEMAVAIWLDDREASHSYKEIAHRLMRYSEREGLGRAGKGFSERTAQGKIPQMLNCGALEKSLVPGLYHLSHAAKQHLRGNQ